LREEQLRHQSYLQAVHETGARLTHDIKNLLQSLNVLCVVASDESTRDSPDATALLGRQLPAIAQRLSATLDKLQRPLGAGETYVPADGWWEALVRQYRGEGVDFLPARLGEKSRLPGSLFDSVADNLIRNALAKRSSESDLRVQASLAADEQVVFRVCDTGSEIPEALATKLLRAPVSSSTGLGIGLYQAARQAESGGYALVLESNRDGEVCFALIGPASIQAL
jgi:signal transduction histidine kinase